MFIQTRYTFLGTTQQPVQMFSAVREPTRCAKQHLYIKDLSKRQLPHSTSQDAFVLTVTALLRTAFRAKVSEKQQTTV
jgi:hypothetical protein